MGGVEAEGDPEILAMDPGFTDAPDPAFPIVTP